jgi:hypothetical protein
MVRGLDGRLLTNRKPTEGLMKTRPNASGAKSSNQLPLGQEELLVIPSFTMLNTTSTALVEPMNQPPYKLALKALYNCNNQAMIQIQASDDATLDHVPSTVILVIDVSGSMAAAASMHDDSDGASGLSQLDIVKHASRTTIESLHKQDQLAVVAFSTDVEIVVPLLPMTDENRRRAWNAVDSLTPTNQTNLYGGLIQALELLRTQESMPSNPNIMLLTDGMPNISPPRGELQSLRNYLDANPLLQQHVRIATFGFGYNLKSQLLADIATVGRSLYAFIPDSSFVGTVFVNAVSNMLSCAVTADMTLTLEAAEGITISHCASGQNSHKTHWGMSIELPALLYGQTLEVMLETKGDPSKEPFQAFLEREGKEKPLETSPRYVDPMDPEDAYFCRAAVRAELIQCIREAGACVNTAELETAQARVNDAKQRVVELATGVDSPEMEKMKEDLHGQITEAYSRLDWHKRWGAHYVLSLASAHSLQQCSNFKDPGLQTYSTKKFTLIRDASEAKFVGLPPPKPSRQIRHAVSSMRAFYRASAPCFASGLVRMADGTKVSITEIKAGDLLFSPSGPVLVRCVVETPIASGTAGLVRLGDNVTVTPFHPVRSVGADTAWKFPHELAAPQWLPCRSVFSLVLEDGASSFQIGEYEAVSLGHGIRGDPVAEHAYLGTDRVLEDLAEMEGWAAGHIRLPTDPVIRNPETSLIVGLAAPLLGK